MSNIADVQFITDLEGNPTGVIIPIDLWREFEAVRETAYLLKSETMKTRLLEALHRQGGITIEEARETLGI